MKDEYDINKLIRMKTKPKRINKRRKGNNFENQIAKILNNRFDTKDFSRSPGSGAFATTHKLPEHMQLEGDLITPKDFKFVIECKKGYNKLQLGSFFNPGSDINKWIRKASKHKKPTLIVFKQDRLKTLALVVGEQLTGLEPKFLLTQNGIALLPLTELLTNDWTWFFEDV
jgi:hypothetical protein